MILRNLTQRVVRLDMSSDERAVRLDYGPVRAAVFDEGTLLAVGVELACEWVGRER